jgi:exodeoxyribonuclease VII large subunit
VWLCNNSFSKVHQFTRSGNYYKLIAMSTMQNLLTEAQSSDESALTVSQISQMIAGTLNDSFGDITVKGEISGFKAAASGHLYFSIKDENAVLNAICWKGVASTLKVKLEEGMEVVIRGGIQTYPGRSNYQIVAKEIRTGGLGALMALLEKRKAQLAAEGLFDADRKKPLPFMPKCIGIVTSPTGAVIKDILHRLNDRWGCHVIVFPCLVQGDGAAEQVAEGIRYFNSLPQGDVPRPDVLIVARGGGSIEDLWAFNEEIVVRAAAESEIPLISAVGHETDTTLIDYASDRRAPTPTAAAEMATPVKEELRALVMDHEKRLFSGIVRNISERKNYLEGLVRGLTSPKQLLDNMAQKLDDNTERLKNSIKQSLENKHNLLERYVLKDFILKQILANAENKLANISGLMTSYDHRNVLKRGFALLRDESGHIVNDASILTEGKIISLEVSNGSKQAQILEKSSNTKQVKVEKPSIKNKISKTNTQESLF